VSASSTRPPASSDRPLGSSADAPAEQPELGLLAATGAAVLLVDQLTKHWALQALDDGPIEVVGSLRLKLAFNSGTAFSVGEGRGGLISLLGLVVVAVLLRSVAAWPGRLPAIVGGLVAGGAIGNLLDRLFRDGGDGVLGGHVVDFIDLQWWPVFNVADMGIVGGALALALLSFRAPDPSA
jgi:signal peptidase II